jgi:hypothetical protein
MIKWVVVMKRDGATKAWKGGSLSVFLASNLNQSHEQIRRNKRGRATTAATINKQNSTLMLRALKEAIDAKMLASPTLHSARFNFCKTVFVFKAPAKAAAPASKISFPDRDRA